MDIGLAEVAEIRPALQPLAEQSAQLGKLELERWREATAARKYDETISNAARLHLAMEEGASGYSEPRLWDFLEALQTRIEGNLPQKKTGLSGAVAAAFGKVSEKDRVALEKYFGPLPPSDSETPLPKMIQRGKFGAYPKQRKALRTAIIHTLAERICRPVSKPVSTKGLNPVEAFQRALDAEPVSFSRANFIEAICLAWFGDAPDAKDISSLIRPYLKESKTWEDALEDAKPNRKGEKVGRKKP